MSDRKYLGKYRNTPMRLAKYDYGQNGQYFITICTHNRAHYFGRVVQTDLQDLADPLQSKAEPHTVELSELGEVANQCWLEIPDHFPFVTLGEFVIMPNHMHGILVFDKKDGDARSCATNKKGNKFGPQSRNLASVIRGFKTGVTKHARQNTNVIKVWQSGYHDRIVRNPFELERIEKYITANPENWNKS